MQDDTTQAQMNLEEGNPKLIHWTKARREEFRRAFQQATREGLPQFRWQGDDFVTGYAKYLLEYLDQNLPR